MSWEERNLLPRFLILKVTNLKNPVLVTGPYMSLLRPAIQLAKDKTGALIVIEHDTPLGEYIIQV